MFCKICGFEITEGVEFCPQCGAEINPPTPENPAQPFEAVPNLLGEKVTKLVSSNLFLAATILVTVSTVGSIFVSAGLMNILFTVFMWTAYASAKKGAVSYNNIRNMSGTVFATKVLYIIAAASSALCAGIFLLLGVSADNSLNYPSDNSDVLSLFSALDINIEEFMEDFNGILGNQGSQNYISALLIIAGVILAVVAVLMFIYALCGVGSIHKFLKSTYEGIRDGNEDVKKINACKNWLLVMGIIDALSALTVFDFSGIQSALDTGSVLELIQNSAEFIIIATGAAAYIIGFVLVGKFKNEE